MDKISPIKKRILHFLENKGITKVDFCEKTGISYANIKGKSLESEFGGAQIIEILSVFDEISSDWLLTGREPMLRETKRQNSTNTALVPIAQKTDAQYESSNKKGNEQEKSETIDKLLQEFKELSKQIGRLETENSRLQQENEQLKKYASRSVGSSGNASQTLNILEPTLASTSK